MEIRLDGRVALVTGASKGIGQAIAAEMAAAGASVMLSSRKEDGLRAAAASITPTGGAEIDVFAANAGDPEAAAACAAATVERFGGLDILVNNAAIQNVKPVSETSEAEWAEIIAVNLTSVFLGIKYAIDDNAVEVKMGIE